MVTAFNHDAESELYWSISKQLTLFLDVHYS